jgi:hypothetical protein
MYEADARIRAVAALSLLTRLMSEDADQGEIQLVASIVESENLCQYCTHDDGRPLSSFEEFRVQMNADFGAPNSRTARGSFYASATPRARRGELSPRDEARFQHHVTNAEYQATLRRVCASLSQFASSL